jgi:DNA-binding transcriptional regulator YiaG
MTAPRESENAVTPSDAPIRTEEVSQAIPGMPPLGVVAAAVLRAARTSARITEACLAAASGVSEETARAWEDGSDPLASLPVPHLERLEYVLRAAGAEPCIVADLDAAAWCDLVIFAITGSEDCAFLLADSLTREDAFRELLAWSLTGRVPTRYRRYALSRRLITDPALIERVVAVLGPIRPDLLPRPDLMF